MILGVAVLYNIYLSRDETSRIETVAVDVEATVAIKVRLPQQVQT